MDRQLVVWCPELLEQHEHGREARAFARVLMTVGEFSPRVETVRPGICALGTRGPSRYFGGDESLAGLVARALSGVEGAGAAAGGKVEAGVGVADGLFAAVLAARTALEDPSARPWIVEAGCTPDFLAPWPVTTLDRPELADLLLRLGITTLGAFAGLPTTQVLARFGSDGAICHEVAAGIRGELPGLRIFSLSHRPGPAPGARDAEVERAKGLRQRGFFGDDAGAAERARDALVAVQRLLHPEAVVRGRLQGGRGPSDRARLVPWGEHNAGAGTYTDEKSTGEDPIRRGERRCRGERRFRGNVGGPLSASWPGQLPSPSPVLVLDDPLPAELADAVGDVVCVTGEGMLSATPARLSVAGAAWCELAGWAGPWPCDERWWSRRARRRQARMQVLTADHAAYLLVRRGRWWVEGIYD